MNSQPTIEQLALELSGGLVQNWPTNGQFFSKLSVKYVILHKIDIANCFLLSHHSDLLTDDDVARPALVLFSLVTGPFQGAHVLDLPATFCPPHRSVGSSGAKLLVLDDGLHPSRDLVLQIMQLLFDESQSLIVFVTDLQGAISTLTGTRIAVDSLLHALRAFLTSSQAPSNS
ncbi:uncharacterized protein E6C27_scaffold17G001460 [Cucumis melo var. makuwa]|uniref:Uncharacterized protein n=1 Tax=Cucumis melo var. makuwa TaxID=1194695 RepID=A0A5A7VJ21_CUCMM|nr:uncharacterized protein E6C27_scaffold17G001460 [Cucumis melo var. makuwa]